MRVVTFYSYKGGVGRTLALLNVAALLVRKGHRVLIADFDLEAPGLDAVSGLVMPAGPGRGVVEFISDYLAEGKVPDARDYCTEAFFRLPPEATPASTEGQLWVMPAGDRTDELAYKQRLSRISFAKLYTERDGFLLFEDLRSQWAKSLNFDYVLIDSRTGHTDVGGICTRQLPDHVVMVFFPNEQNLKGIEAEVRLIREQPVQIEIDAVMSRIPKLDDHKETLQSFQDRTKESLGLTRLLKVNSYDHLDLLLDFVFSADASSDNRQLSKEYRAIADTIVVRNRGDRSAVLASLELGLDFVREVVAEPRLPEWIRAVREYHRTDEDVLAAMVSALKAAGRDAEADATQSRLLELTETGVAARQLVEAGALEDSDPQAAVRLALDVVRSGRASAGNWFSAFGMLCRLDPDAADEIDPAQPVLSKPLIEAMIRGFTGLLRCRGGMNAIYRILVKSGFMATLKERAGIPVEKETVPEHATAEDQFVLSRQVSRVSLLSWAALACGKDLQSLLSPAETLVSDRIDRERFDIDNLPAEPFTSLAMFGLWLRTYADRMVTAPPGRLQLFMPTFESDQRKSGNFEWDYSPCDGTYWEVAGVPDDADFSVKSRSAFAYALFGQTDLARQLVREIDETIAANQSLADLYVMNCWRMLNRPLSELRDDLLELADRRERDVAALGKGESLKIIQPPFGQRRSSRTSP